MIGEEIRAFFKKHAPDSSVRPRTENALIRGGVETMDQLAGKSDDELLKLRNMGEKCLALAAAMRDKYRQRQ